MPYSVFFPAPSLYAMNPCFFRVNCYLCNKNRHKRSLGCSSFDIIVSKPECGCTLMRRVKTSRYCWFRRVIAECGLSNAQISSTGWSFQVMKISGTTTTDYQTR